MSARGSCSTATARSPPTRTSSPPARARRSRRAREVYVEFADGNHGAGQDPRRRPERRRRAAEDRAQGADAAPAAARRRATASRSASRSPRSARRSASASRCRSASSRRSTARSSRSRASASPARSRPTRRSTPATPAARWSTRDGRVDRHQPADQDEVGRRRGRRASRSRSTPSSARWTCCATAARRTTPTSASRPCQVYPQLVDRFHLGVGKGAWVQEVDPGGPAEKAGITRRRQRARRFQAQRSAPAAT